MATTLVLGLKLNTTLLSFLPTPACVCVCVCGSVGEFATYLNFCRSLKFEDRPDYTFLRQLFRNLFHKLGYAYDYVFDWNTQKLVRSMCCVSSVARSMC